MSFWKRITECWRGRHRMVPAKLGGGGPLPCGNGGHNCLTGKWYISKAGNWWMLDPVVIGHCLNCDHYDWIPRPGYDEDTREQSGPDGRVWELLEVINADR